MTPILMLCLAAQAVGTLGLAGMTLTITARRVFDELAVEPARETAWGPRRTVRRDPGHHFAGGGDRGKAR